MNESLTRHTGIVASLVASLLAGGLLGCEHQVTSGPDLAAGPMRMSIETQGLTLQSGSPAEVDIYAGPVPTYQLSLGAGQDTTNWGTLLDLSREQTLAGQATVPVTARPLDVGQAAVQTEQASGVGVVFADSGSVSFTFSPGRITGSAGVTPETLSASFEGELSVACWVVRSHLPNPPQGGTVSENGVEPLVLDDAFVTPECAPFRALRAAP